MDTSQPQRLAVQYQPKGRRDVWRPAGKWKDYEHLELSRNTFQDTFMMIKMIQYHYFGKMHSFWILEQMVHKITTVL
jgi:hypothetical protein